MQYLKRLKDLREDNDLKQENIAKVLNITRQQYQLYESGKRKLPIDQLIILAKYYSVSADYILGLTNDPDPKWKVKKSTKNNVSITNNGNGNITMGNIKQK